MPERSNICARAYLIEFLCKKPGFSPEVVMLVIAQKPGFFWVEDPKGFKNP
jgi:hypothetical protein